jgi:hypothetical protein
VRRRWLRWLSQQDRSAAACQVEGKQNRVGLKALSPFNGFYRDIDPDTER